MEVLCVDLGGTKLNLGLVSESGLGEVTQVAVPSLASKLDFSEFLLSQIGSKLTPNTVGVSIGVPGLVDVEKGRVISLDNIPNWFDVDLAHMVERNFALPLVLNNDANCFVMGEHEFGQCSETSHTVGLTLGTGLGCGLVLNDELYCGFQCGAGEIGNLPYLGGKLEDFTSSVFFKQHSTSGINAYVKAQAGDVDAQALFTEFGAHLAYATELVIRAYSPNRIVFGGSISGAYEFFKDSLMAILESRLHDEQFSRLTIAASQVDYAPLLGAYALFQRTHSFK